MNFRRQIKENSIGFQIAPMVDIVFTIVLFLLVSQIYAQWERTTKITIPTADKGTQELRAAGEVIVNIDSSGRIFINEIEMSPDRLKDILRQTALAYKGYPVIIRADRATDFQYVVTVLDICQQVDIWNISFATLPAEGKTPLPGTVSPGGDAGGTPGAAVPPAPVSPPSPAPGTTP